MITYLAHIIIVIGFFSAYYKMVIQKEIIKPDSPISISTKIGLFVLFFTLIIGIQLWQNFYFVAKNRNGTPAEGTTIMTIVGETIKANIYVFLPLIMMLISIKEMLNPFTYTFGNMAVNSNFQQLQELSEGNPFFDTFFLNIQEPLDIIDSTPEKFYKAYGTKVDEDGIAKEIYNKICEIVMIKKVVANIIWFVLAGIFAIMKSLDYSLNIHELSENIRKDDD